MISPPQPLWKPTTVEYSCTGCGDCCQFPSPIYISAEEAESIGNLSWPADSPFRQNDSIIPTRDNQGRAIHRLAKQPEGNRCVFLNAENRCAIHAEFGEAAKPAACRAFPRVQVSLGAGSGAEQFSNYSLACRCAQLVALDQLVDLIEPDVFVPFQAKDVELKLESGKLFQPLPFRDWAAGLMSFFLHDSLTADQAIAGAYKFAELTLSGDPNVPTAEVLRSAITETLPAKIPGMYFSAKMDPSQRSLFFQILYYSINPGPVDFYEQSRTTQERIKAERLTIGEAFRDELNAPLILNEPLQSTFSEIRSIGCGVSEPILRNILGSFFCTKLLGLRFHSDSTQPFAISLHLLLLACAEVLWVAKAFAAEDQRRAFSAEHLERAIRLVDSSVGTLTLSMFPKNVAEAWRVLFGETCFAIAALKEMLLRD